MNIDPISEATVIHPDFIGFAIDVESRDVPIIGLEIRGHRGEHIVMPLDLSTADDVGRWLMAHALSLRGVQPRIEASQGGAA